MFDSITRLSALFLLLFAAACSSTVPPQTRVFGPIDTAIPPTLYVATNDEREAVVAALELAGFTVVSDIRGVPFVLMVRLGSTRAGRDCGSVRNVTYALQREGVNLVFIKGRGWTGSCDPNILQDMSDELARLFGHGD